MKKFKCSLSKKESKPIYHLLLSLLLVFAQSCFTPDKQDEETQLQVTGNKNLDNSSFRIGKVTGSGSLADSTPVWGIPSTLVFEYEVCIISRNNRTIREREFLIKDGNRVVDKVYTDPKSGCLQWYEPMNFDYFANPYYIEVVRQIEGMGLYAGSQQLRLAVNPWANARSSKVKEVYDLDRITNVSSVFNDELLKDKGDVQKALAGTFSSEDSFRKLFVENVSFGAHVNKYFNTGENGLPGADMNINLEMTPKIAIPSFGPMIDYRVFDQGKFKVELTLISKIHREGKVIRHVLNQHTTPEYHEVINGKLSFNYNDIYQLISYEGQLELGIKLIPFKGLPGVNAFQGNFLLGKYNQRTGLKTALLKRDRNDIYGLSKESYNNLFSKRDILNELKNGDLDTVDSIRILRPFIFSLADFRFVSLENDTPLRRTISYRIKTCIKEEIDGEKVQFQKFKITLPSNKEGEEGQVIYPHVDENACLLWPDKLTHDFYVPERLFKREYKIEHVNSGYSDKITGYLNPWDPGWTFGREAREINPGVRDASQVFSKKTRDAMEELYIKSINDRPTSNSELFLSSYGYETIGFNYDVDEFLTLFVKKKILLRLHAGVKRYSSMAYGLRAVEPLRDGIYLFKAAFHKNYYDPTHCINIIPKEKTDYVTIVDEEFHGIPEQATEYFTEGQLTSRCGSDSKQTSSQAKKTYVDVVKKLVKVEYGQIITPIELTVRNLSLKRIRSQLLLQIEPIDLDKLKLVDLEIKNQKRDLNDPLRKVYNFAHNRIDFSTLNKYITENKIDFEALTEKHNNLKAQAWKEIEDGMQGEQLKAESNTVDAFSSVAERREKIKGSSGITLERFNEGQTFNINPEYLKGIVKEDSHMLLNSRDNVDEVIWRGDTANNKGLVSRTFVGPIQLLSARFGPPVRGTDTISSDVYYDGSGHTGSSDDLADVNISMLEKKQLIQKDKYLVEKKYESLLFNYADRFNLDFASLGVPEEKLKSVNVLTKSELLKKCTPQNFESSCLQIATRNNLGYSSLQKYLNFTNTENLLLDGFNSKQIKEVENFIAETTGKKEFKPIQRSQIKDFIIRSKPTESLAFRMCYYFVFNNLSKKMNGNWGTYVSKSFLRRNKTLDLQENNREDLINTFKQCTKEASKKFSNIFTITRQIRSHKIDKDKEDGTKFVTGKSLNMNVGSDFGFRYNETLNTSISSKSNPVRAVLDTVASLIEKWIPFAKTVNSAVNSAINVDYGAHFNTSDGTGTGTSVSTGVYLVIQRATFDIYFKERENCASIRFKPSFINDVIFPNVFKSQSKDHFIEAATRGLFLCSGDKVPSGKTANREYFYYFAQHFTAGDLLDDQDLRNHPWLLSLRGERDFLNFIENIKAYRTEDKDLTEDLQVFQKLPMKVIKWHLDEERLEPLVSNPSKEVSLGEYPINQLINAYKHVEPTFPGIYNLRPNKDEYPPYPYTR